MSRAAKIKEEIERLECYLDDLEYVDSDEAEASREDTWKRIHALEHELESLDKQ